MKFFDDSPWSATEFTPERIQIEKLALADGIEIDLEAKVNEFTSEIATGIALSACFSDKDGKVVSRYEFDDMYYYNGSQLGDLAINMDTLLSHESPKYYIEGCISQALLSMASLKIWIDGDELILALKLGTFYSELSFYPTLVPWCVLLDSEDVFTESMESHKVEDFDFLR